MKKALRDRGGMADTSKLHVSTLDPSNVKRTMSLFTRKKSIVSESALSAAGSGKGKMSVSRTIQEPDYGTVTEADASLANPSHLQVPSLSVQDSSHQEGSDRQSEEKPKHRLSFADEHGGSTAQTYMYDADERLNSRPKFTISPEDDIYEERGPRKRSERPKSDTRYDYDYDYDHHYHDDRYQNPDSSFDSRRYSRGYDRYGHSERLPYPSQRTSTLDYRSSYNKKESPHRRSYSTDYNQYEDRYYDDRYGNLTLIKIACSVRYDRIRTDVVVMAANTAQIPIQC